jgi:hypothetical protein
VGKPDFLTENDPNKAYLISIVDPFDIKHNPGDRLNKM